MHAQHEEMAWEITRERLSASLATRPTEELLRARNILPDGEATPRARKLQLAASFAARPPVEELKERHILHEPDERAQRESKRHRLEGLLAHRPNWQTLNQTLGGREEELSHELGEAHRGEGHCAGCEGEGVRENERVRDDGAEGGSEGGSVGGSERWSGREGEGQLPSDGAASAKQKRCLAQLGDTLRPGSKDLAASPLPGVPRRERRESR
jgi:hypothetical protein